jgi:hypothetical protein
MTKRATKAIEGASLIAEVERLELRPGDVIVCRAQEAIRPEFKVYLEKQIRRAFPGHRCLVIDGPVELFVMSETDILAGEGE